MKRIIDFIIILFSFNCSYSQEDVIFSDLLEITDTGKVKYYLSKTFQISHEDCLEYYMICSFDKDYLKLQDSVCIYFKRKQKKMEGFYRNGKRDGLFIWYHDNGIIECKGEYALDQRKGIWEYFYPKGNIHKRIYNNNNTELILDLYDETGKQLVKDGEGYFNDTVLISGTGTSPYQVKGSVMKGTPTGIWEFFLNDLKIGSEYFENNIFKKGISHSKKLGDLVYYDYSITSYSGVIHIENLSLITPARCGKNSLNIISYLDNFYENLKKNYLKSDVKKDLKNTWFLVENSYDNQSNIKNIEIFSNTTTEIKDKLRDLITKTQKNSFKIFGIENNFKYFPIVILNGKMYLPGDEENEILRSN